MRAMYNNRLILNTEAADIKGRNSKDPYSPVAGPRGRGGAPVKQIVKTS